MAQLYGEERCRWFAGEHRLNDTVVKKVLIPLIDELVAVGKIIYDSDCRSVI